MGIYYINRLIAKGPQGRADRAAGKGSPTRPLSSAAEAGREALRALGRTPWNGIFPLIWAAHHRHRGRDVRHPRRLRSRHRHPVSVRQGRARARPDDDLDRAVLGRQRDLAGAGRRRAVGRVPAGLCGDHAGVLPAGDRDAAGAGVPRRRVRVPRGRRRSKRCWNCGVRRRLDARRLLPGRDPRRPDPGHPGRERRVRRRRVRLGDAVRAAVRARRRRRLRAARRHLAGDEDRRRRSPSARARRPRCCCSRCSASWRRSACGRRSRFRASPSAGSRCRTSSISGRCRSSPRSPRSRPGAGSTHGRDIRAVPRLDRAVPARLSRPGDLVVSRISCRRR